LLVKAVVLLQRACTVGCGGFRACAVTLPLLGCCKGRTRSGKGLAEGARAGNGALKDVVASARMEISTLGLRRAREAGNAPNEDLSQRSDRLTLLVLLSVRELFRQK
jgi:hypothetical protein